MHVLSCFNEIVIVHLLPQVVNACFTTQLHIFKSQPDVTMWWLACARLIASSSTSNKYSSSTLKIRNMQPTQSAMNAKLMGGSHQLRKCQMVHTDKMLDLCEQD